MFTRAQGGLGWTDAQRAELRPAWRRYLERIESSRREAACGMDALRGGSGWSSLAAMEALPDTPLGPLMAAYSGIVDSVSTCDAWMRLEMFAYVDLTVAFYRVRRPGAATSWPPSQGLA